MRKMLVTTRAASQWQRCTNIVSYEFIQIYEAHVTISVVTCLLLHALCSCMFCFTLVSWVISLHVLALA